MADKEKNNPLSTGNANFNFYLNRQGAQGQKGEKGDEGFSPYITQGKNTLDEYTMIVTNENSSFETPNLREHKEDRGGTYFRYDRDTGIGYVGDANQATPELKGEIRIATQEDFDRLSGDTAVTPETLSSTNPLKLGYIDDRDETRSGSVAYVQYKTDITGDASSKTIAFESAFVAEVWENGVRSDTIKYYLLGQNSLKSTDGSVNIIKGGKTLDLKVNFPPAYTLPIATATVLGGIKIGEGLSISEDGTVSVKGGSHVLPAATATTLGGIKAEPKTGAETNEVKIDPTTSKLYVAGGGSSPTNYVTTDTEQQITAQKEFTTTIKVSDDIVTSEGLRIANGGLGAGMVSLGDSNANLTIYSNGAPQIVTNGDAQTLIDTGNIGNYAATTQDVEELNTKINTKQDILTAGDGIMIKEVYPDAAQDSFLAYNDSTGTYDLPIENPANIPLSEGQPYYWQVLNGLNTNRAFDLQFSLKYLTAAQACGLGLNGQADFTFASYFVGYKRIDETRIQIGLYRNWDNKRIETTVTTVDAIDRVYFRYLREDEASNVQKLYYKFNLTDDWIYVGSHSNAESFINNVDCSMGIGLIRVGTLEGNIDISDVNFQYTPARPSYLEISSGNSFKADIEELGNELNQLANDVTNIEGQIGSINTEITKKQNASTFTPPLNVNTSGYNPTFLTDNKDGTFKSNIITIDSASLIRTTGTNVARNYVQIPCTDTTYFNIDWSKLIYYKLDKLEGLTFRVNGEYSHVFKMHFCRKSNTFLPRFSSEISDSNYLGKFATYNKDITPDSIDAGAGSTVPVGVFTYTGENLAQEISTGLSERMPTYLQLRFENANDSQYTIYYKDTPEGVEKSLTIDKSIFNDVDVVVFTQTKQNMNLDNFGVFDSNTGKRLWSPLQAYDYPNDVVLNRGTGLAVQDGKLDLNYDNLTISLDYVDRLSLSKVITASGSTYTPTTSGLLCAGAKSSRAGDYVGISSPSQDFRDFRYGQAKDQWIAPQMHVNAGTEYTVEYSTTNLTYCYFYPYKVHSKS